MKKRIVIIADVDVEKLAYGSSEASYMAQEELKDNYEDFPEGDEQYEIFFDVTGSSAEVDDLMRGFFGDALPEYGVEIYEGEELVTEAKRFRNVQNFAKRFFADRKVS